MPIHLRPLALRQPLALFRPVAPSQPFARSSDPSLRANPSPSSNPSLRPSPLPSSNPYDWEPSALGMNLILPLQIVGILALHVLPGLANNYSMFCLSCVAFVVSSSIAAFTFVATTQRMVLSPLAFVLSLCSSNVAEQVYKIVPVAILAATCPAQLFASVTTGTSLLEGILGACLPVPMTHVYTLGSSLGLWSTSAYTLGYCSFLSMQGLALVISRNLYT